MKGRIHSFQSLGTVDGPGVRCVVFMQGCPLRCVCCHNPDTWDFNGGEEADSSELVKKILRFRNYFRNGGGVTLSGGEPLMQAAFAAELFEKLKEHGINTALDTSGCIYNEDVERLLSLTDIVLLDSKYENGEKYLRYTGCEKEKADRFLDILEKKNIETWIRRVIIPGLNDTEESVLQLKKLKEDYSCISRIQLLPFRKICMEKYESMNMEFPLAQTPEPGEKEMQALESLLE